MTASEAVDDARIVDAIRVILATGVGPAGGRAIEFYADPRIAAANPAEYARTLQNIFGRGAGYLLMAIVSGLGKEFGVQVDEGTTLDQCIGALRPRTIWSVRRLAAEAGPGKRKRSSAEKAVGPPCCSQLDDR